jgi:hypothetical protein
VLLHIFGVLQYPEVRGGISVTPFIFNKMAERVGFEFTQKRSFNNIECTAGNLKQWKAVASSANGSQTDHGSVIGKASMKMSGTFIFCCVIP